MMKSLITSGLALAALSVVSSAQSQLTPVPVQGPLHRAIVDASTGQLTKDSGDKAANLVTTFVNTDTSGWYSRSTTRVEEWLNWGTLASPVTDRVGSFQFGYATSSLHTSIGGPGVSIMTNFYSNVSTWCGMSGGGTTPDFSYTWTSLPGASSGGGRNGWLITAGFGTAGGFQLANGTFGYAMGLIDFASGPLLCYAGTALGGADANGHDDVFDIYVPDVATTTACGSYWFGGVPSNFSSWYLVLNQLDNAPAASHSMYCGSGVNPTGYSISAEAVLGGTFTSTLAHARSAGLLYGYATPLTFPYNGQEILVNFLDPFGELLGNPLAFGNPAVFNLPLPSILFLVGFDAYIQPVSFGGGFDLHCAAKVTVGF